MKTLNSKLVITRLDENQVLTAAYEEGKLVGLQCDDRVSHSLLGNIYVGKVKNIVSNIQAAFIDIGDGKACYYSFEDNKYPVFTSPKKDNTLRQGDELLVQVSKENIKTKAPVVTSNLNITGRYLVLTTGNRRIGISNKLGETDKRRLKKWLKAEENDEYGLIVRTNAANASKEDIIGELTFLKKQLQQVLEAGRYRSCYSLIYRSESGYLRTLKDTYTKYLDEIVTDDEELHQEISGYLNQYQPENLEKLRLYQDDGYPLKKCYSLETEISQALSERVWLKSGAYLIIQQTEALVVVDVNTGKFTGKKNRQATFLKINLEAADEIARQLRLRNLSGIVIVDFIDMEAAEDQETLLTHFEDKLNRDPVKTTLVGMTGLHLVEVTRMKVRKSLKEQLTVPCRTCGGKGYFSDYIAAVK